MWASVDMLSLAIVGLTWFVLTWSKLSTVLITWARCLMPRRVRTSCCWVVLGRDGLFSVLRMGVVTSVRGACSLRSMPVRKADPVVLILHSSWSCRCLSVSLRTLASMFDRSEISSDVQFR